MAGLSAGANDYVCKPFDSAELKVRVQVGLRVVHLQEVLMAKVLDLQSALEHVKTLQGILPICMYCNKIRNDQESWEKVDRYVAAHTEASFSHTLCPECLEEHYPEEEEEK